MGRRKKIEKELLDTPEASAEARGIRVRRIRNMANLSRQKLCEESDININTLKGWEIGRYGGLTRLGAEKLIHQAAKEGVSCTLDWLMYGIGIGPSVKGDFTESHSSSEMVGLVSEVEETKIANELSLFKKHYNHAIDYIVPDDSMMPIYQCNDYVAGVELSGQKITKAIGQNCIIRMACGTIILRQLRKGVDQNNYTLMSLNIDQSLEPILYNVKVQSAAPVIFHRKKYKN